MKEAFQLLDLVIQDLPSQASQVPAWAEQASRLLMGPLSANDEVIPPSLWWDRVADGLGHSAVRRPLPLWVQVLSFAWSCPPSQRPGLGALERILLHWWPKVDARRWPAEWSSDMLAMALKPGLIALAVAMVRTAKAGWTPPRLDGAFQRRHGLTDAALASLKEAQPPSSPRAIGRQRGWLKAQSCASAADIEALRGQDMLVPLNQTGSEPACWPEHAWPEASVQDWPAMSKALGHVRAADPKSHGQHEPATAWLRVRALNLGHMAVARQLGWEAWLGQGDFHCAEGPGHVQRHLLDVVGRERMLGRSGQLARVLDHVFQATLSQPASTRQALLGPDGQPGLRFWCRALACAWSQPANETPPGRRGPRWWRWLMHERADLWASGFWQAMAPEPQDRWMAWLRLAIQRSGANPLHLLATTPLKPAHALLGAPFPWASLPWDQEQAWAKSCLFQLVWDSAVEVDPAPSRLSRWTMWAIQQRLNLSPAHREIWLPVMWALLGEWETSASCAEQERVWRRLSHWVEQHPSIAHRVGVREDHVWTMLSAPRTLARWRALLGSAGTHGPQSSRGRVRS